ncbi:hypothetical protein ACJX0J_035670, partial [Zea mays]
RLCDNDPGVMGATLCPLYDLISEEPNSYKDLVVSFVNILKQVAERRLPTSYDYHQMPAPFIQIKLLKILAVLGSGDKQASGHMYTVLGDIFKKGDTASNIGNAILYECICCISSIFPNPKMLVAAAETTSKFLKSDSHNLKYMGIDALGRLIKINPDIAEEHQLAVIDCLEDPDDTLKRKTFELLYKMTKSTNVEVIVDRMIEYMINITDHHYKTEIASRCVELAEQFAPSNQWFIQTMNRVFEHAGDLVNIRVAHNLMRLIAEGFGDEDEGADSQLRSSAVDSYVRIVGEPKLPSSFLQIICWVLGEYGTADGKHSASYIIGKLCDVAEAHLTDDTVKAYAISAILKIFAFEIALGRRIDLLPECQTLMQAVKILREVLLSFIAVENVGATTSRGYNDWLGAESEGHVLKARYPQIQKLFQMTKCGYLVTILSQEQQETSILCQSSQMMGQLLYMCLHDCCLLLMKTVADLSTTILFWFYLVEILKACFSIV